MEGCQIERLRPVRLRPSHLPLLCARPSQRGPPERRIRESPSDAADTEGTESARREPMGSKDVPLAEETEPEREDRRRRRVQAPVRLVGLRASLKRVSVYEKVAALCGGRGAVVEEEGDSRLCDRALHAPERTLTTPRTRTQTHVPIVRVEAGGELRR